MFENRPWINLEDLKAFIDAPSQMGSPSETRAEKVALLFQALEFLLANYKINRDNSGFRLERDSKTIVINIAPDDLTSEQKTELAGKLQRVLPISKVEVFTEDTTLIRITTQLSP